MLPRSMQTTFGVRTPNFIRFLKLDPMRLRRATAADIPQMRRMEEQAATAAHWSAAQYEALFAPDGQARVALIAADESADSPIQGFLVVRCLPDEWEIENLVVDAEHRRRGIGSALIHKLLAEAQKAGVAGIILEARESNRLAVRLYESIGFKLEGLRKNYYQDPREDALLFRISVSVL
jgi:ribosomal-protein-alanine N-acetyltransferase